MNSWAMGNRRQLFGASPNPWIPIFQLLHSFMHHSAFRLNLDEGTYELTLLKKDMLHHCQGLIESLQENAKLVTTSFHSKLPGDKDFRLFFWKGNQTKDILQPHWKVPDQVSQCEWNLPIYRHQRFLNGKKT